MSNEIALLNKDIKRFKGVVADLSKENKQLKIKLEKIKEIINECMIFKKCESCKFYKECDKSKNMEEYILKIIEGAEDE